MVLLECRGGDSTGCRHSGSARRPAGPRTGASATRTALRQTTFPPYRLDQDATHGADVGARRPAGAPPSCPSELQDGDVRRAVQYWVPWIAADGTVYDGGPAGCCRRATRGDRRRRSALPEQRDLRRDRHGRHRERRVRHLQFGGERPLGCSQTVACSLVAVPIMGISCDARLDGPPPTAAEQAALADCEATGSTAPARPASSVNGSSDEIRSAGACGGARPTGGTGSRCR